jgi:iron only hydrogenase large subunit-like protein
VISSTCPGIAQSIKQKFPQYAENIAKIDSPMVATGKICRKVYKGYKTCFISPCHMKKIEAQNCEDIDYVIDYQQLHCLFQKNLIAPSNKEERLDRFYNDYTKIYPLSGGLSKTAHLKQVIRPKEEKIIDGWKKVERFLKNPDKNIRFLDVTFCKGGCIGGPCTSNISLRKKKRFLNHYFNQAKHEKIPCGYEGLIEKAKGINFLHS